MILLTGVKFASSIPYVPAKCFYLLMYETLVNYSIAISMHQVQYNLYFSILKDLLKLEGVKGVLNKRRHGGRRE